MKPEFDVEDRRRLEMMIAAIDDITRRGGLVLSDTERDYLRQRQDAATELSGMWDAGGITVADRRLRDIINSVNRGFFDAAYEGVEYGKGDELATNFSSRVETNYPEASDEFIKFARTYWSIKGLNATIYPSNTYLVQGLLALIEVNIETFFPYPGHGVNPDVREQRQREILRDFGPKIDVERFMQGNAILIRDRLSRSRRGCACVFVILAVSAMAVFA